MWIVQSPFATALQRFRSGDEVSDADAMSDALAPYAAAGLLAQNAPEAAVHADEYRAIAAPDDHLQE